MQSQLYWYYHRLRAMSFGEILYRIREKSKREADRYFPRFIPARDHGRLPVMDFLQESINTHDVPPDLLKEWQELAIEVTNGRFFLLAQHWQVCNPHEKWHLDPVSGIFWDKNQYCFDINFRHNPAMGDVKYTWELNRLQYLQPMAALAYRHEDNTLAAFCIQELISWIDHNPPFQGINWASGIELAMRLVSISVVVTCCNPAITREQRVKIWQTLEHHGVWLDRYPSRYSSANNHRAAEGLGLFLLGTVFTPLKQAKRWREKGWNILCDCARILILPDGSGAEQAVSYHAFTLEMLMLGMKLAVEYAIAVPDGYRQRIIRGGEFLHAIMDKSGNFPAIGDDDNARVLGVYQYDEQYVHSVLGCIAALNPQDDLAPPCPAPHLRNFFFGFPLAAQPPADGVHSFTDGGYSVMRQQQEGREILLVMDHGALGYLSIAAHGHADALSVWLHLDGQLVLVDAGTYLYHSGGQWRDYFRSTRAHNTLCVEDTDSSSISGHFNWSHKAQARLITAADRAGARPLAAHGDMKSLEAEHDGYHKRFGVMHRRRVTLDGAGNLIIADSITGSQAYKVSIGFLIHPSLEIVQQTEGFTILKQSHPILTLQHQSDLASAVEDAWYSTRFGEKQPAKRIVFSGILAPGKVAVTGFCIL